MLLFLLACTADKTLDRRPVYIQSGNPVAGVAEGVIDVPVGAPMGGYSSRCTFLGGDGSVDRRQNQYTVAFSPSVGIQTAVKGEVLWLENGDQDWVLINIDAIYIYDEMLREIERQLSDYTGRNMVNKVVVTASHTHQAPANFSDQIHFYLGGDRYNEEIYQRYTTSLVNLAKEAFDGREEAHIGFGVSKDWDPNDLVYRDRRPENDDLILWDDQVPGKYKDPYLWMIRVDRASDDSPMGVFFNFGIHGTSLGADNPLISVDAPGHLEFALQEHFDADVVISHFQGGGGDISPAGSGSHGHEYARMEGIGEFAAGPIFDLWNAIPTSGDAFSMESITRSIPQSQTEIKVTRNGTVDWHYNPFQADYVPDDEIYDENGAILSPLDEFNTQYGAVFCGYDDPLVSTGTIGSNVPPYDGCMKIDLILNIISGIFQLSEFFPNGVPMPMPDASWAQTSSVRMGPVSILQDDGTVVQDELFMGFFPGETTSYFLRHYRDRVLEEVGYSNVIVGGYSQDHEGYLLIPEDWLVGGYEPNINVWGPLQAEHIMEGNLQMSQNLTTDLLEPSDPHGHYTGTEYPDRPLPTAIPDSTPSAGTVLSEPMEDFYIPLNTEIQTQPSATLSRVQGLAQIMWSGGDPAVDFPHVLLEREENGQWIEVTTPGGRLIDQSRPEILLAHMPTPLYPYEAEQEHHWWAGWQTVGMGDDRMGLPLGTYRFHIYGHKYTGNASTYPWPFESYEVISETFEILPAQMQITMDDSHIWASIVGPDWGYRLIDMDGSSNGHNPPFGAVATLSTATETLTLENPELLDNGRVGFAIPANVDPATITSIEITDIYDNAALLEVSAQ